MMRFCHAGVHGEACACQKSSHSSLVDALVAVWAELYDAATSGNHDARSALIEPWHPMVATIENFEAAARGFVNAIERYRQDCIADRELTAPLDLA
jgi:hypothetical protein